MKIRTYLRKPQRMKVYEFDGTWQSAVSLQHHTGGKIWPEFERGVFSGKVGYKLFGSRHGIHLSEPGLLMETDDGEFFHVKPGGQPPDCWSLESEREVPDVEAYEPIKEDES